MTKARCRATTMYITVEESGELFIPRDIFLSIVETYDKHPERFKVGGKVK